jgi:hypothetical protein
MNLTPWIVGILGVMALALVGGIAYLEVRPLVDARRAQLEAAPEETTRIYTGGRRQPSDSSTHAARLLISLILMLVAYWEWGNFRYSGEWLRAQGVILDAYLETQPDGRARGVVWFSYQVGDRTFTSAWMDGEGGALEHIDEPAVFAESYPTGQTLTVWYHPMLPKYPSLARVTLWYVVLALACGSFLMVTSSLSLLAARKLRIANQHIEGIST